MDCAAAAVGPLHDAGGLAVVAAPAAELCTEAGGAPGQPSGAVQCRGLQTEVGTEPGLSYGAAAQRSAESSWRGGGAVT
jgi:hypothetical protein